jgi:hypothetical protein
MKSLVVVICCFCLYACEFDPREFGESFGVVYSASPDGKLYVKDDNGAILIPVQDISTLVDIKAGSRVWTTYAIESQNYKGDTLNIDPYRISDIRIMPLQTSDTDDRDGIDIWRAWFAQGFLTFDFSILAQDPDNIKEHEYALVLQKYSNDTAYIHFKHNAQDDNQGQNCRTAIAMSLQPFAETPQVVFAVQYTDLYGFKQTIYRTCTASSDLK